MAQALTKRFLEQEEVKVHFILLLKVTPFP